MHSLLLKTKGRVRRLLGQVDWLAPLLARVTLGVLFMSTGWGKVHNLDKVTGFFTELGIPAPAFQATLEPTWNSWAGRCLSSDCWQTSRRSR